MYVATLATTVNSLGGLIGAFGFVVAAVFGTLYGLKRAEKDKDNNTISVYKTNSEALQKLLDTREQELKEATVKHDENLKRIELLEQKANILENQVTQAPSIEKLINELSKQSTARDKQHKEQMEAMQKMTSELGNIAKNIIKNPVHVTVDGKA